MRKLIWIVVALAVAVSPTPAFPQTPALLQEAARWSAQQQALYTRVVGVFQNMPPYQTGKSDADLRQWLGQSREWIGASRRAIAEVRAEMVEVSSLPRGLSEGARQALAIQQQRFPEIESGVEQFLSRYSRELDAIERGDAKAASQMALSTMDAASFTVRLMRDVNNAQAGSIGDDHPQHYLLRSFARSYDAMLVVTALDRAALAGEAGDRESAARSIVEAGSDMRQHATMGRRAATAGVARVGAARLQRPDERAMQERVVAMLGTYPASFDQELEIAGHLDSVARLLRDSRSYEAIAPELDAIHLRIEVLDTARVADGQRRIRFVQGQ